MTRLRWVRRLVTLAAVLAVAAVVVPDSAVKPTQMELVKINRSAFARNAAVRSWGCHTGESMSKKWRAAVGNRMYGAVGKTQYMTHELPILSSPGGRWTD